MKTRKKPLSTSVDPETYERIKLLATLDRRSIAEIAAMCAAAGLEKIEREMQRRIPNDAAPPASAVHPLERRAA